MKSICSNVGKTQIRLTALLVIVAFSMLPLLESMANAEEYEFPSNRNVSEILPAEIIKGPHYRIQDKVVSYGYLHHYTVESDFGVFKVTADSPPKFGAQMLTRFSRRGKLIISK